MSCYGHRMFAHFAHWFGLASIEQYRMGQVQADCLVAPTPLLGQLFELAGAAKV